MTTAFQLIHPTVAFDAANSKSTASSTVATPTWKQQQQQRRARANLPTTSVTPHPMQPTTPGFPLALIASSNVVASSALDASTTFGRSTFPAPDTRLPHEDGIVERRHQMTFAGHPFTSVIYSRNSRQSAVESPINISEADLLELDPNGSLYVVPAWYVIVDHGSRQLNIIEPKLLSEITSRLRIART